MSDSKYKKYTKCLACGNMNLNRDYCENCGEYINYVEKRKLELEQREKERRAEYAQRKPSKIKSVVRKGKTHDNALVRILAKLVSSVWFIALTIISTAALVFAYLAL